jgi:predicted dehydrogenase
MNELSSRLKVVIRGTGSIGMRHARVFRDLLGMETISVSRRLDRTLLLKKEGYATAQSLPEAITGSDTILIVASDTSHHVEDAMTGVLLGCRSILIEKPISPALADSLELQRTISKTNTQAFVACNLRFDAGLNLFRQQLEAIGEIHHVRIEAQSYLPEWRPQRLYQESYSASIKEGGVLRDLIHEIDYAIWLYGEPTSVTAQLSNSGRLEIAAEESADLLWRAPSGATVSIRLDYVTRHYRRVMTAFGSKGDLTWDFSAQAITLRTLKSDPLTTMAPQDRDEMMRMQAVAFVNAATNGNSGQLATFEEGMFAMAVCDAARVSSSTGRAEAIGE